MRSYDIFGCLFEGCIVAALVGCASENPSPDALAEPDAGTGSATAGAGGNAGHADSGKGGAAGAAAGGSNSAGGNNSTGGNTGAGARSATGGSTPVDGGPLGTWSNVTPPGGDTGNFGMGVVVADPKRPSDLYIGGNIFHGLQKSSDYGLTWTQINAKSGTYTLEVANTSASTPATLWTASSTGTTAALKSTDGGVTWVQATGGGPSDLYSIKADPYDITHLISGLHEADGVVESTDGGATWTMISGSGWPSGGISWYPYFLETGSAETTRQTWIAIAQNGGSVVRTSDKGAHWTIPSGASGLQHPHGNSQAFQTGSTVFVGGVGGSGQGVYRSADLGVTFSKVDGGAPESNVWGTPKYVYSMYGWACDKCTIANNFEMAAQPGATGWSAATTPSAMAMGPISVATTFDGSHYVFVASLWSGGLWRYVEP
jgi:hypothetical protein